MFRYLSERRRTSTLARRHDLSFAPLPKLFSRRRRLGPTSRATSGPKT